MNLSEIFIRRPVMTTLLMVLLFVFGVMGYRALPISDVPNVDFPTIQVSATLPGAAPETMATAVATPLESQLSTIAGIDNMSSSNTLGQTQITLQFNLDRNIDAAAQDVQAAITAAAHRLPQNLPNPPTYSKINPAASPVLYLALHSVTLPISLVDEYAETFLARRISMVDGVAQVSVYGSQKFAVRIQANPDKLAAYQLGIDDVANAVQKGNVNLATGVLNGRQQAYLIQTDGQLTHADAYKKLVVAYRNGAPVKLSAVANVIDSVQNNLVASWTNGTRSIVLAIQRQPGSNTIAVVNNINNLLPMFQNQLPAGMKLVTIYDRSQSIRASVVDVQYTLLLAAFLVVLIVYLFLKNRTATLITCISLPLSIFATFALMRQLQFSLDNISLLGLTLVVGFVVDDAIVMLENIFRHHEYGENRQLAALNGSKEISFTILSMTLSLMVVFVPVLFMNGILGRLLYEFGITIMLAILMSGIISLTLTPMLCSKFLSYTPAAHETSNISKWSFENLKIYYSNSLHWVLNHRRFTLALFGLTLLLTVALFLVVSKGFLPDEDTGQILGFTEADTAVSFTEMVRRQHAVAEIIQQNPNVDTVMSTVGSGGVSSAVNTGRILIRLKALHDRADSASAIIQQMRQKVATIPGINIYLQNIATINIGKLSKSTYQYTLQDSDMSELNYWGAQFLAGMSKLPELQDVTSDLTYTGPQVHININRDKASALGITAAQIETTLADAYGTSQVSTILTAIDAYAVILELRPEDQLAPDALSRLFVRADTGKLVPLSAVTTLTQGAGPMAVNHQGQLAAVTLSFNLKPNTSLGNAVASIEKLKAQMHPPTTLLADFQGTAQAFQASTQGLGFLLLMAIFVIYIVLGILYESFIHPLTILSGLPAAGAGALMILVLLGIDLNFYSFIGIIMLVGIVKKNAIMMIDFAIAAQRNEHKTPVEAIYQACIIRFRPIMMTSLAALMGTLPIALALGTGSASRRPLGMAVVGGLLVSQTLTLYITPVIYLCFNELSLSVKRHTRR